MANTPCENIVEIVLDTINIATKTPYYTLYNTHMSFIQFPIHNSRYTIHHGKVDTIKWVRQISDYSICQQQSISYSIRKWNPDKLMKISLKITKEQSEAVNIRRTSITMTKAINDLQNTTEKTKDWATRTSQENIWVYTHIHTYLISRYI